MMKNTRYMVESRFLVGGGNSAYNFVLRGSLEEARECITEERKCSAFQDGRIYKCEKVEEYESS